MKPNYRGMAWKWRALCDCKQVTINHLQETLASKAKLLQHKEEVIRTKQGEIDELKAKYSALLSENVRLLEAQRKRYMTEVEE